MKKIYPLIFLIIAIYSCNKKEPIKNSYYDKAYLFLEKKEKDSAFKYFNRAKDIFLQHNNLSHVGNCLVNMGIIQCNSGDYYGGQETALSAIQYFNIKDDKDSLDISSNYNNLGIISNNLKEYNKAIVFYDKAAQFSTDFRYKIAQVNNKAVSYSYLKQYDSAISILKKALSNPNLKKYPTTYYRIYDNLAYNRFLKNPSYNAEPELSEALQARIREKDINGQITSLSHLSTYLKDKDNQKSLMNVKEMLKISLSHHLANDRLEALQKIILLEHPENIKPYFEKYQYLNDSLTSARNKSKSQFAFERFEAEKLKTENLQKENQILLQNIGIASLILLLIGGTISGSIWIKRRKERLQKENELKIKENELKISKKVHDVVANGIYQVMTKIENQDHFDKDKALDELEFVYEKSRDISYEKVDSHDTLEFYKKISNLIGSFKNEKVNTFLAGNGANIWMDLNHSVQDEVYQIMRELLVNMKKHSQANLVAFKFERNNNLIQIQYTDNGIGIPGEIIHGNGLSNTVSRIEKIKGTIIFDNTIEKGLKVYISFPIS